MAKLFRFVQNPLYLPGDLVDSLMKFFKDRIKLPFGLNTYGQKFVIVEKISEFQEMVLNSVLAFFKDCKVEIPYPIQFCQFVDEAVCGYADTENKVIFIGINALESGKLMTASTLMEEKLHIESGYGDESREFQEAIFGDYLKYVQYVNKRLI
jgi:hypothetical protein